MTNDDHRLALHGTALGPSFELELAQAELPRPGAGQLLIRTIATGVNHIDLLALRAEMPPGLQPKAPFVGGVEGVGVVVAVGEGAGEIGPGERVLWFGDLGAGGFGSHVLVAAHQVARVSASVGDAAAAALPVAYTTALHMLTNLLDLASGAWILVHAAGGGVGLALVELAKALELRVIATDVEAKREAVRAAGAESFVDFRTGTLEETVREATGGAGLAASFNCIGGTSLVLDAQLLAPFGSVILYGFLAGLPETTIAETLVPSFGNSVALRVSDIYTLSRCDPQLFQRTLARVAAYVAEGRIAPRVREFDGAQEAFATMEAKTHIGKLVLTRAAWSVPG